VDLSNLTNPVLVGYGPGPQMDVKIKGSYVYGTDATNGVRIIDVSDPTTPAEVAYSKYPGWARRLDIADRYVYVANDSDGLVTLWYSPSVTATIPLSGGSLISPLDHTIYNFPANTFSDTVEVTHTSRYPYGLLLPEPDLKHINHVFDVSAKYSSSGQPAQPEPGKVYSITVEFDEDKLGSVMESTLSFYFWDGTHWQIEPSVVDTDLNTVTANPSYFSTWAILGKTNSLFIPVVLRSN